MAAPDVAADVVPRTPDTNLRIATFNVENLFSRPIAMDYEDNKKGQPFLDAFRDLNSIVIKPEYSETDKARIVELMTEQKLTVAGPRTSISSSGRSGASSWRNRATPM
jgi:hypothetical protein